MNWLRRCGVALTVLLVAACGATGPHDGEALSMVPQGTPPDGRELFATGFVVDRQGLIVTAGHAVGGCGSLYVVKGDRTLTARVVARAVSPDLALLDAGIALAPPAVLATGRVTGNAGVFVAGYRALPRLLSEGGGLFNAVLLASDGERAEISLVSDAQHGSSGAPVLDGNGLVVGVVSRRTSADRVFAVENGALRAFLAANGVTAETDTRPQLDAFQDRARRAATISVGIRCFAR